MKHRRPGLTLQRMSPKVAALLITAIAVAFVGAVLVPGLHLATALADNAAALKFVGEQRRYPRAIASDTETVLDRLNSRSYLDTPLNQLREDVEALSGAIQAMTLAQPTGWFNAASNTAALADPVLRQDVAALRSAWDSYQRVLAPVIAYHGMPYIDNEASGASVNQGGKNLAADATTAIRESRRAIPLIDAQIGKIGRKLQTDTERATADLRLVMFIGLAIATVLVVLVVTLQVARVRQDQLVEDAQRQTENIFRTVKEGLFLLDQDLTIGSAYSDAMRELFKRNDIAGLPFEQLLAGLVPDKTLKTAMKYVKVLWSERTNEKLVKSINPLGEVEVRAETDTGAATQHLEFNFHRVRTGGLISHVLVAVSDVSARVALANELKDSQEKTQAQIDTLLTLLQVDPGQLGSFLNDSDASMKMVNSILREPAREEAAFRRKLDSIFRQVHSVKGEAAAIGLTSIQTRAHSFEEDLQLLREKRGLTGNDFLPLIVKLDDLFTHMQSIRDLVSRLSRLQVATRDPPPAGAPDAVNGTNEMVSMLEQLTQRVALDSGRKVRLECAGIADLPPAYRRMVKDISVQAIRNAIVHGVEPPKVRVDAGKPDTGLILIQVHRLEKGGYKLIIEDDGQGLQGERIVAAARARGLISAEEASVIDNKLIINLLFRSGLSTATETTPNAGRGVGMQLIADLVQGAGGRISMATTPGRYTRLTVTLPALEPRATDTEAA